MKRTMIETLMGGVVLLVAAGFLMFAYSSSNVKKVDGYKVIADFSNVTGVAPGSDVRVGGIKIGAVEGMELNTTNYQAELALRIREGVSLPKDSSASISSSGLLGDKFVAITPGGDSETIVDGGRIDYTQSSVSIEEMIGKFAFSGGGVDKEGGSDEAASGESHDAVGAGVPSIE